MRKSGAWMTIWDDRIMEFLSENGAASVGDITESVKVSNATVSRRCRKLADYALLRPIGNGVYDITERGEKYLNGEINTYDD
ncbi:winged helix-turn-helix domain-containing protein [Haloarcula sp. H-GB4]|uniref:winged helix-turn-helix domain-containing protein n=1 Tax=Haloarcula sp. H-GB4 TaxID=3069755 RepID=UPI00359C9199